MRSPFVRNSNQGSVLIVTLGVCAILGVLVGSYLAMVKTQQFSVARARSWNTAMAMAEAGIEEAMANLNDTNTSKVGYFQGINKWINTDSPNHYYLRKTNALTDGYYDVTIIFTNALKPLIVSTGYIGGPISSGPLTRIVQVQATQLSADIASGAMVVQDTIDLKGATITTDSFNSSDLNLFPGGIYNAANARDLGDVTTISSKTNAISIGNGKIKGTVHTGPKGKVDIGAGGVVGDKAFVDSGNNGGHIQSGHMKQDAPPAFPDATLPDITGAWLAPVPGNYVVNGVTYKYQLTTGKAYKTSTLDGSVYVAGAGVKLWVTGSFNLNGEIRIPAGKSLAMYVGGAAQGVSAKIAGNGIINDTGLAKNFLYYGLPQNTSLDISGNGGFIGEIYAPQAVLTLGGGGSNGGNGIADFTGCSITWSAKLNGTMSFHFDESAKESLNLFGYRAQSWDELFAQR